MAVVVTINKIATEGYDVQYGARPLRRAIQRIIEDPICEMLLSDKADGISEDKVIRL